ncbi:MAG: hypothetical protein ABI687_00730 [Flavitalea sp.]
MVKTGSSILFIFSLAAVLLPLFPLAMLFVRRPYPLQKVMPLVTLCLIAFFKQVLLLTVTSSPSIADFITAVFNMAEMTVLLLLLRSELRHAELRQGLSFLLIAVLSTVVTIYSLEGITDYAHPVEMFISCLILLISLFCIIIISNEEVFNLRSPLFWIAGGSFCYYAMFLLSEGLRNFEPLSNHTENERFILLASVYMVRYVFYIIAAYVSRESKQKEIFFQ